MAATSDMHGTAGATRGLTATPVPTMALVLAGLAVLVIWGGVVAASMFAPDFVSGSPHAHLALVAGIDWIWGLVATSFVVLAALQGIRLRVQALPPWVGLAASVAVVWIVVALVSVFAPVMVTGTDPTIIPLSALGIPILGTFLTWVTCTLTKTLFEAYRA